MSKNSKPNILGYMQFCIVDPTDNSGLYVKDAPCDCKGAVNCFEVIETRALLDEAEAHKKTAASLQAKYDALKLKADGTQRSKRSLNLTLKRRM